MTLRLFGTTAKRKPLGTALHLNEPQDLEIIALWTDESKVDSFHPASWLKLNIQHDNDPKQHISEV